MARTRKEIYQSIVDEKERVQELANVQDNQTIQEALSDLDEVNNTSVFSPSKLWQYIVSYAISLHEQYFDIHKQEVEQIASKAVVGTNPWLVNQALLFQDGDTIEVGDNYEIYYPIIDQEKQIINRASAKSQGRVVYLKVAKGDPLEPLSAEELTRLKAYINDVQFAGTQIVVQSSPPDQLSTDVKVDFDGSIPENEMYTKVQEAINTYLVNMEFDGTFVVNHLRNQIEAIKGVRDVVFDRLEMRVDGGSYFTVAKEYNTVAGYVILDSSSTNITLLPA